MDAIAAELSVFDEDTLMSYSSDEDGLLQEEQDAVDLAKLTANHVSKRSDYYINDMKYYSSGPASAFPLPFELNEFASIESASKKPASKESASKKPALKYSPAIDDSEDEEDVYPLSKKYIKSKDRRVILTRYIMLSIALILFILFVVSSVLPMTQTLSVRLGYFADKITTEEFTLADFSEIAVNTKNCITYLLESNGAADKAEIYVSADRSSSIDISIEGSILNVKVVAEVSTVQ
jgi:hypothetical protein